MSKPKGSITALFQGASACRDAVRSTYRTARHAGADFLTSLADKAFSLNFGQGDNGLRYIGTNRPLDTSMRAQGAFHLKSVFSGTVLSSTVYCGAHENQIIAAAGVFIGCMMWSLYEHTVEEERMLQCFDGRVLNTRPPQGINENSGPEEKGVVEGDLKKSLRLVREKGARSVGMIVTLAACATLREYETEAGRLALDFVCGAALGAYTQSFLEVARASYQYNQVLGGKAILQDFPLGDDECGKAEKPSHAVGSKSYDIE